MCPIVSEFANSPIARKMNVSVSAMKTSRMTRFVLIAAKVMYRVKMPQARKKTPTPAASTLNPLTFRNHAAIQNRPYDVNAVAPKVFLFANSQIPAMTCPMPP